MSKSTPKVEFQFGIKSDTFNNNLKQMNNNIKKFKNEADIASNGIKQFGKNAETLGKQYTAINKALGEAKDKVKLYDDQMKRTTETINKNKDNLAKLGAEKDKLNAKYKEAVKTYGKESDEASKLKTELDNLNKKYKETENKVNNNVKSLEKYSVSMSNAEKEVSNLETQLAECNKEIEQQANKFLQAQSKLESASNGFKAVGGAISDVSDKMLAVSVPIAGAGVAIAKMEMDFEDSLAKVSTLLEGSTIGIDKFRESLINLSNNTGQNVNDLSESLYQALSAGVDAGNAMQFLEQANKLATGGFTDSTKAVDVLTTALNAYGLEANKTEYVSDILVKTQNLGKTSVDQLASSLGKVIPTANACNVGIDQLGASYAILTAKGVATAESTTYINSMLNELSKSGTKSSDVLKDLTGKGFAELVGEGKNVGEILNIINKYASENGLALNDMFGSAEAAKAAMVLVNNEGKDFTKMLGEMQNATGETEKAFKKMSETEAYKLKKSIENVKNSFLETGEALMPTVEMIAEKIAKVAEAIGNMDEETVANTIKMAGWGVVIGTVGKAVGGMTTGIGNALGGLSKLSGLLAGTTTATATTSTALGALSSVMLPVSGIIGSLALGFYAVHEANDVMQSSILKSTDEMSLMEKGMASLMGVQKYSKKELQNMSLVYKDFTENISDEFQNKVKESEDTLRDFNLYLKEINFDNLLSEDELSIFDERVNSMVDSAIATMESRKQESNEAMQGLFADDGIITESEQKVLDFLNRNYDTNISETNKLKEEVFAIKQRAIEENRGLNEQEIKDVEEKLATIKRLELEAIGGNEEEIAYAKNEFNARMSTIDLQSATDLLTEKSKIRDEETVNIKAAYDTQIEMLKGKLSVATEEEKGAIETEINNLEQAKNDKIKMQNDLYDEYLKILAEKNSEIASQINKFNGELLSEVDKANQEQLKKMQERYDGINDITESGWTTVYDTISKTNKEVFVNIDEKTGEIIGVWDEMNGTVAGYTSEISGATVKMGTEYEKQSVKIKSALKEIEGSTVNSSNKIVNANGEIVGSLDKVKEGADGTREGILNLNGTPVKVTVNKDGTISALDEIDRKIDNVTRPRQVNIDLKSSGISSGAFAVGTSNATEGIANINEKGWELIDTPIGTSAFNLASALQGDMAYIPEGTRIQTNLSSTQQMKAGISKEVNKAVNKSLLKDIENMGKDVVQAIKNMNNGNATFNNTYNVTNKTDFDAKKFEFNIEKGIRKELRKLGRRV